MRLPVPGRKKPELIKYACLVKNGRIICFCVNNGIIDIRIPGGIGRSVKVVG